MKYCLKCLINLLDQSKTQWVNGTVNYHQNLLPIETGYPNLLHSFFFILTWWIINEFGKWKSRLQVYENLMTAVQAPHSHSDYWPLYHPQVLRNIGFATQLLMEAIKRLQKWLQKFLKNIKNIVKWQDNSNPLSEDQEISRLLDFFYLSVADKK